MFCKGWFSSIRVMNPVKNNMADDFDATPVTNPLYKPAKFL